VIERVVEAAMRGRLEKSQSIRIRLSPAHLGELLIELILQGSTLQGRILTENEAAKDLIGAHLGRLRQSLEGQGIQVGDFQVAVDRSFTPRADARVSCGGGEGPPDPGVRLRSLRPQVLDVTA
jgi:flagellar hook-length control protein FliK